MCGLAGIVGTDLSPLAAMVDSQHHRGPDLRGTFVDADAGVALGHNRLAIIDLSAAGRQPMADPSGRYQMVFNGEIYNYRELRAALADRHRFRTETDSEVLLAAYRRWGADCLDRLIGMFALVIWDARERTLFAARDRFGVKPLYLHQRADGGLLLASEIRALHAAGVERTPDHAAWARYLTHGVHDRGSRTFWQGIRRLPAGHRLTWRRGRLRQAPWYRLAERLGDDDHRGAEEVREAYRALLVESVGLRFRSDVPVGINLSGGLDSSVLLAVVHAARGADDAVRAFTFTCGDPDYDELPWVERMLAHSRHPLTVCPLSPAEVPALAASVQAHQDEPFGGLPTLAYAKLFEAARAAGVIVLLDGQGMDEQWAGYDYYRRALSDRAPRAPDLQGARSSPVRPGCLTPELRAALGEPPAPDAAAAPGSASARLRAVQLRDLVDTKLPRSLRFNDRVSMRASCELREPFLDHRLVELAMRQPAERKIRGDTGKAMLRDLASALVPGPLVETPKRPLQTPQREWLRGPLRDWSEAMIDRALADWGGVYLEREAVRREWRRFQTGRLDNGFFVWQWISLGLLAAGSEPAAGAGRRRAVGR